MNPEPSRPEPETEGGGAPASIERLHPRPVPRPWGGGGLLHLGLPGSSDGPIGEWWLPDDGLGLLVKIIDARQNLSIQLHPDDATAERLGLPCGKAEAWYVLEAAPGARLWVGLEAGVDRERLLADARSGRDVSELLNVIRPTPGTVINVPPGTVHAIGAGLVLLEVQQVSDTTFRLFDWNRQPARELHLEEAGLALREDPAAGLVLPAPFRERSPGEPRCMLLTPLFELAAVRAPGTTSQPAASAELWFAERGDTLIRHGGQELLLRQGQFCKISGPIGTIELVPAVEQAVTELIRVRTT